MLVYGCGIVMSDCFVCLLWIFVVCLLICCFVFEFVGMFALRFLVFGFNLIGVLLFTELLVAVGGLLFIRVFVFIVLG